MFESNWCHILVSGAKHVSPQFLCGPVMCNYESQGFNKFGWQKCSLPFALSLKHFNGMTFWRSQDHTAVFLFATSSIFLIHHVNFLVYPSYRVFWFGQGAGFSACLYLILYHARIKPVIVNIYNRFCLMSSFALVSNTCLCFIQTDRRWRGLSLWQFVTFTW